MFRILLFSLVLTCIGLQAQQVETPYKSKKIVATRDTIYIDSTSVNSSFFKLLNAKNEEVDATSYHMNFQKGTLVFKENYNFNSDTLTVRFLKFPIFLTKEYSIYDSSRVVKSDNGLYDLYKVSRDPFKKFVPMVINFLTNYPNFKYF